MLDSKSWVENRNYGWLFSASLYYMFYNFPEMVFIDFTITKSYDWGGGTVVLFHYTLCTYYVSILFI